MPFEHYFEDLYEQVYKKALEECDLSPKRADSIYRPSPILHDIWTFINQSSFILADITGKNPNVMYELGLAHAIAKPAIIITDNINEIPFDLRNLRIIPYSSKDCNWGDELKSSIKKSIKEIEECNFDDILPSFLKTKLSQKDKDAEIKEEAIKETCILYYYNGLHILDITSHLISKYHMSNYSAKEIIDIVIKMKI